MEKLNLLVAAMIQYEHGCPERIQHFIKVHGFARWIGLAERLPADRQLVLEAAALVHDIGIRPALENYGSAAGPLQESEGVEPARRLLGSLGFAGDITERVCFLVAHHHTYTDVDGLDYQILLEADFLVNAYENASGRDAILAAQQKLFATKTGKQILCEMFDL